MKSTAQLPDGYAECMKLNLQEDKKTALIVNFFSFALAVLMMIIGNFICPILSLFEISNGFAEHFIKCIVMCAGMIAYLVLHELVHGICMKAFGADKVKYGFTGLYAYAGSDCYFGKKTYIIIALAPIVVWGIVLLILNFIVDLNWFWIVYIIQVFNVSGAAGDLYVSFKFVHMPKSILVKDTGIEMTVYALND